MTVLHDVSSALLSSFSYSNNSYSQNADRHTNILREIYIYTVDCRLQYLEILGSLILLRFCAKIFKILEMKSYKFSH